MTTFQLLKELYPKIKLVLVLLVGVSVGTFITNHNFYLRSGCKPLFEINVPIKERIKANSVIVTTNSGYGSGCAVNPDVYLTSLHVVQNAILNNEEIKVGEKPAKVIYHSHTDEDYAFLSTNPAVTKINFVPNDTVYEGQLVIIYGNPGYFPDYYQQGRIEQVKRDKKGEVKPSSVIIATQYMELGGSGSCVYDTEANLIGAFNTKLTSTGSSAGTAVPISATFP